MAPMYHWKAHWSLPLPGYGTCDMQHNHGKLRPGHLVGMHVLSHRSLTVDMLQLCWRLDS